MRRLTSLLLATAASTVLEAGAAQAQATATAGGPIYLEAGQVTRTGEDQISAQGNVEARFGERTLRADALTYDMPGKTITARGGVQILQPDGSAQFADSLVFDDTFSSGVATGFSARLPEGVKLAATSLIRRSETLSELNQAIFTPCEICAPDGSPKPPGWAVSAESVVRDEDKGVIRYRNAILRIKGVPVLFVPAFVQTDPSVKSRSGLLRPDFSHTRRRGVSWEQPILWDISPYQDLVVSPQFNTEVNPFLNLHWRKRFYSGDVDARLGYTYEQDFNSDGRKFGSAHAKAYILANGDFELNEDWRWGFTAQGARDRRLFDQYSISDLYDLGGLYRNDDRRLISQVYGVRQDDRSYLSIAAMGFQSLRPLPFSAAPIAFGVRPLENNSTLPTVAPLIEYRYEPENLVAGGRLRARASSAAVTRDESPLLAGAPGIDSARVTVEADWRRAFTLASGVRLEPYALARSDAYRTSDRTPTDTAARTSTRGIATLGLDASYPFIRYDAGFTTILEPLVQLAVSPRTRVDPDIPNEDGIAFDFDDTNLFEFSRFPGYDLYEGGSRMNIGLRSSFDWGVGQARAVVGRSYRTEFDPAFPARTGLRETASDWVAGAEITPSPGLWFYTRARFDQNDFGINKFEAGANVRREQANGYLRYMRQDEDFSGARREDLEGAGEIFITSNWGISIDAVRDLEQQAWRRRSAGIIYRDECMRFEILYRSEDNPVLGQRSADSFLVRLTLATLGDTR